jgi:hypothetical protein
MRRRIRLTGRRQLPRSCVQVGIFAERDRKVIGLTVSDRDSFRGFPTDARVRLRLNENKLSEVLEFGTVGTLKSSADLRNSAFSAPSCQLRIVASSGERNGLLLGSTDSWTLRTDDEGQSSTEGILMFQPRNIAPRTWKLEIRDSEHPIVYIDKTVPDPRAWVRSDPVFISTVLPAIIQQVFASILSTPASQDIEWMQDWLRWADVLAPGTGVPSAADDQDTKDEWTDRLLDSFCIKHRLLDRLVGHVAAGKVAS